MVLVSILESLDFRWSLTLDRHLHNHRLCWGQFINITVLKVLDERPSCAPGTLRNLILPQVFTGIYLAAIEVINLMLLLFPFCGSKIKPKLGEYVWAITSAAGVGLPGHSWVLGANGMWLAQGE